MQVLGLSFDAKDLGALGGAASAMVAAASYWLKTRHERRRATRTALFYLLEMHHVLRRVQSASTKVKSDLAPELGMALRGRGITVDEKQLAASLTEAEPVLERYGRSQLEEVVRDCSQGLGQALAELAKEDPVLAYRLRGREQLLLLPQRIDALVVQHVSQDSETSETHITMPGVESFVLKVALVELDAAIRETARKCDMLTFIRTTALLFQATKEEHSGELGEVIRVMAKEVAESVAGKQKAVTD